MSDRKTVPALDKAIRMLGAIAELPGCSNARLARDCGVAPATAFRILNSFQQAGWIRHAVGGGWELGTGLMPLVNALQADRDLVELVRPHLRRLVAETGVSAKCSIREDLQQVIILSQNANRPFSVNGDSGTGFSILNGSSGAALLLDATDLDHLLSISPDQEPEDSARLMQQRQDDIRHQGWCAKIGVHPQGIDGISAPVRDSTGRVCCALTLLGLRGDMSDDKLPALAKSLRDCVAACQLAITNHQQEG